MRSFPHPRNYFLHPCNGMAVERSPCMAMKRPPKKTEIIIRSVQQGETSQRKDQSSHSQQSKRVETSIQGFGEPYKENHPTAMCLMVYNPPFPMEELALLYPKFFSIPSRTGAYYYSQRY